MHWRVIVDPPATGDWNMAVDHALAEAVSPGEGVLRFYRWAPATVSFGRNEPAEGIYSPALIRDSGAGVVRRPTGGRAVFHDRELTYSVVVPLRALGGARATYVSVHEAIAEGLSTLGMPTVLASPPEGRSATPDAGPCFAQPAGGEVLVHGRKLVGSAQARMGANLLQHGSLILGGDQRILDSFTMRPLPSGDGPDEDSDERSDVKPDGRASEGPLLEDAELSGSAEISVREVLGEVPQISLIEEAVLAGFRNRFGGTGWERDELEPSVHRSAEGARLKYGSQEWTWRR